MSKTWIHGSGYQKTFYILINMIQQSMSGTERESSQWPNLTEMCSLGQGLQNLLRHGPIF